MGNLYNPFKKIKRLRNYIFCKHDLEKSLRRMEDFQVKRADRDISTSFSPRKVMPPNNKNQKNCSLTLMKLHSTLCYLSHNIWRQKADGRKMITYYIEKRKIKLKYMGRGIGKRLSGSHFALTESQKISGIQDTRNLRERGERGAEIMFN